MTGFYGVWDKIILNPEEDRMTFKIVKQSIKLTDLARYLWPTTAVKGIFRVWGHVSRFASNILSEGVGRVNEVAGNTLTL